MFKFKELTNMPSSLSRTASTAVPDNADGCGRRQPMIESELGDDTSLGPVALRKNHPGSSPAIEELTADKGDRSFPLQLDEVGRHITLSIRKADMGSTGGIGILSRRTNTTIQRTTMSLSL